MEVARRFREGQCSAHDYAIALLARIDECEARVQAWTFLDRPTFLAEADEADLTLRGGTHRTLSGVPIAIKDIIDVKGMPTEDGTPLHQGRIAGRDADLVRMLRQAGAIPMGKTVTTELATYAPGKTRNPHGSAAGEHTPGGSSSGSAAAVAAGMVPLAVGTQTNGSVIRPASFCGVYGFKPSFGSISRAGVLEQSDSLDQIGGFARTLADVAALVQAMCDPGASGHWSSALPPSETQAEARAPQASASLIPLLLAAPRIAVVRTPFWDRVAPDARSAFDTFATGLAHVAVPIDLPVLMEAVDWHRCIMEADLAKSFHREYEMGRNLISASLCGQIERGLRIPEEQYRHALGNASILAAQLDRVFDEFDAILTPATLGTAPPGLASTGDPIMCTAWTLAGVPALSLPLLHGANGLPLGVQLIGPKHADAQLLRVAQWLVDRAVA